MSDEKHLSYQTGLLFFITDYCYAQKSSSKLDFTFTYSNNCKKKQAKNASSIHPTPAFHSVLPTGYNRPEKPLANTSPGQLNRPTQNLSKERHSVFH